MRWPMTLSNAPQVLAVTTLNTALILFAVAVQHVCAGGESAGFMDGEIKLWGTAVLMTIVVSAALTLDSVTLPPFAVVAPTLYVYVLPTLGASVVDANPNIAVDCALETFAHICGVRALADLWRSYATLNVCESSQLACEYAQPPTAVGAGTTSLVGIAANGGAMAGLVLSVAPSLLLLHSEPGAVRMGTSSLLAQRATGCFWLWILCSSLALSNGPWRPYAPSIDVRQTPSPWHVLPPRPPHLARRSLHASFAGRCLPRLPRDITGMLPLSVCARSRREERCLHGPPRTELLHAGRAGTPRCSPAAWRAFG